MRDPSGLLPIFMAELFTEREPNAEAVDDQTVKTFLNAPDADYLSIMGSHWWTVETKEAITRNGTELGEKGFGDIVSVEQMRGAGPFYPTEYVPASGFKLARNPHYYASELPYVDEIDHPLILDPTAAAAALEAGELDAFGPLISFPINLAFDRPWSGTPGCSTSRLRRSTTSACGVRSRSPSTGRPGSRSCTPVAAATP